MTNYVVGFVVVEGGEVPTVALIEKQKGSLPWMLGRLNGLGGKVQEGETAVAAMVREAREEAGVWTEETDWEPRVTISGLDFVLSVFITRFLTRPTLRSSEDGPVRWYEVSKLPAHVVPNVHWLLPLCRDRDITGPFESPIRVIDNNPNNRR